MTWVRRDKNYIPVDFSWSFCGFVSGSVGCNPAPASRDPLRITFMKWIWLTIASSIQMLLFFHPKYFGIQTSFKKKQGLLLYQLERQTNLWEAGALKALECYPKWDASSVTIFPYPCWLKTIFTVWHFNCYGLFSQPSFFCSILCYCLLLCLSKWIPEGGRQRGKGSALPQFPYLNGICCFLWLDLEYYLV